MAINKLMAFGIGLALIVSSSVSAQSKNSLKVHFKSKFAKREVGYLVFNASSSKKNQGVVVFLHPGASAGNNLEKLSEQMPDQLVKGCKEFSLLTIAPQLPLDMANKWPEEFVNEFLDDVTKKYKIDKEQVFITGFGKGGGGTWDYIVKYPERVTAAIPIGGYGNPHSICKAKDIPILAFHGGLDKSVPAKTSRELTRSLHKCGGKVLYTEYPNLGYDESWKETYGNPAIYKWLNSKHKNDSTRGNQDPVSDFVFDKNIKAYKLPKSLQNIGGIVYTNQNKIFAVNESGNQSYIIETDTLAHVNKLIKLDKSSNLEWSDMSKDDSGNILIGDIGNTLGKRSAFQIYIFPMRETYGESAAAIPEKFEFTLSEQSRAISTTWNFESLIWYDNNYYMFTTLDSKIYVFRILQEYHIAEIIKTIDIPTTVSPSFKIASADLSPDFKTVALLGEEDILLLSGFTTDNFFGGTSKVVKLGFKSSKSGLSFIDATRVLISEKNGNGLYEPHLIIFPISH